MTPELLAYIGVCLLIAVAWVMVAFGNRQEWRYRKMTIARERTNAISITRNLLIDLLDPKRTPRVPLEIRQRARAALRHFPMDVDIHVASKSAPSTFTDPYEERS